MPLTLASPAFAEGKRIPPKYSRQDKNLSPPLRWSGVPDGTRSLALIVEDPDAPSGVFRHWCVYNIRPDRDRLPESVETGPDATGLRYADNDFGYARYDGPQPPRGHGVHHYHFRLVALDVPSLDMPGKAGAAAVWKEARKHAIEEADLVGTFER
jgi:Raf kinase inhibitor-like YbhB/YbcL family protein